MDQEDQESGVIFKEQDRLLPIANVGRIMKQILPANAKISKEAKETMQECASEFISFVTGEASDRCRKERRKTVNGDDVCWAMAALGFDDHSGPMRRYLQRYREIEGDRSPANQEKGSSRNVLDQEKEGLQTDFRNDYRRNLDLGVAPTPPVYNQICFNQNHDVDDG